MANRQRSEVEALIGFFVNTLAIRLSVAGDPTVAELLAQVKQHTLGAYAHQDLPFEQIVEAVNPRRSQSHAPLFQTMLTMNNTPDSAANCNCAAVVFDRQFAPVPSEHTVAHFDLSLSLNEGGRCHARRDL